jgi:hypothetical protein
MVTRKFESKKILLLRKYSIPIQILFSIPIASLWSLKFTSKVINNYSNI